MLAEMIGTTRSRVSNFMNKFRNLGFVSYSGGTIEVHSALLSVLLTISRISEEMNQLILRGAESVAAVPRT